MLQKIGAVRQDLPDRERHWFQDDFFDLFAWTDAAGAVLAFQLCYDRLKLERVLAWSEGGGFIHRRIDDGEAVPRHKMSPIMVADGEFPASVAAEFGSRSTGIDAHLRQFVRGKIDEAVQKLPGPRPLR